MLPGLIKPLVWSINIPMVNSSWKKIFREMIGKDADGIDIQRLARPIYYRAYFNMGRDRQPIRIARNASRLT